MARSRLPAGILQDLRSSLRSLGRSWGLIGVAVFSLAVGIGANTAVFSAVDVFMLRPLPYPDSERLQGETRFMSFAIEAAVPLETLSEPVRAELRALDPTIPAYDLMPFGALIDRSLGGDTIMAKIMGAVAVIALVLALGGFYGVMAYNVSQRTRELRIRTSLGATRGDLVSMVMRQGTILAFVGIAIGVAVALAATRGLARFLFGVSPFDPITFGGVAGVLFLAALVATFFPALRAARVDPVVALRTE